jgi:hypothetical protein
VDQAGALEADSFVSGRVLNNTGTELIFPPRVDIAWLEGEQRRQHGHCYGRPTLSDNNQPTFRGLFSVIDRHGRCKKAEGDASEDLVQRVQELQARRFEPVARELFGTPLVMAKMLFANVLLPGQEISMHHDVPEFRGIHPKSCPNWLQVVMHHSGLFARWRILQAAALTYFQDMEEGSLAIYCGPNGEGSVVPARRGLGVIVEAETCPHHSDIFMPTSRQPVQRWPQGVRLRFLADEHRWSVTGPNGAELDSLLPQEVRVSTQMKLHCFQDEAALNAYLDHTGDLKVEVALDMLTEDLRRRGRFGETPSRSDLAVMMVHEYVRWPTPAEVANCWGGRPGSVFARALVGSPIAAPEEFARARL